MYVQYTCTLKNPNQASTQQGEKTTAWFSGCQ